MENSQSEETKGIRIEANPSLYQYLTDVQKELRPQAGRKIPLADILTQLAMISITDIGSVTDAARVLLNGREQLQATDNTVTMPQYVSTSTAQQNVQNIWETVEQIQFTDSEAGRQAANLPQSERSPQPQADEQAEADKISSANICSHESYAREYLDNYHYCLDMLKEQAVGQAEQIRAQESGQPAIILQAEVTDQWFPVPVGYVFDAGSMSIDDERLAECMPDLFEDDDEEEPEEEPEEQQATEQQEKSEAILRIVHSLLDHKGNEPEPRQDQQNVQTENKGTEPEPRQDQEQAKNIGTEPKKVLLRDNPLFKEWLNQQAGNPTTPQEPSEEEKRKAAAEQQRQADIEKVYQAYTVTIKKRILYILKKEGIDSFFGKVNMPPNIITERLKEERDTPQIDFAAAVANAYGDDYGRMWLLTGSDPGKKVCKEDFYNQYLEFLKNKKQ
jgi:hypothetical protein